MMSNWNLNPKHINQPIQLLGASLIGSVLLVGEFLYASTKCNSQIMAWFFGITAILIFPIILWFIFTLQTKHREKIQSDYFFNETMKRKYQEESKNNQIIKLGEFKKWIK